MTTRHQQETVRDWLLRMAAGDGTADAQFATWALQWIAELGNREPPARGPMVQIRARGPVSISELKE